MDLRCDKEDPNSTHWRNNKSDTSVQDNYRKRFKCGHVVRMKEEHTLRRMLDVKIQGKRRRGHQT